MGHLRSPAGELAEIKRELRAAWRAAVLSSPPRRDALRRLPGTARGARGLLRPPHSPNGLPAI